MRTFGERLHKCIEDRNTSQAAVARAAGISDASVSEWAGDKVQTKNVKAEPLLKAAAFLDVSPMWLLTGRGQRAAMAPVVLEAAEQAAFYRDWPFERLDRKLISKLQPLERAQVEGAWIVAAVQLGFSLAKPAAA